MAEGKIVVEVVGGKSKVTRCFSKYPLKFIIPKNVGPSDNDAVWIYSLAYGGGIVSGDSISCHFTVADGCTAVLTTQASTKVYKSQRSRCSVQVLEARVGSNSLFAVIPDPVTCFAHARYSQKQVFRVCPNSSLVIVDWITSGRHESGEIWNFELYKSTNQIYLENDQPVFLDTMLLEKQQSSVTIGERMQGYQVIAMLIIYGTNLKFIQEQVQENVKTTMSELLRFPSRRSSNNGLVNSINCSSRPEFVASCSLFGPKGVGLVVRIAAITTESVYNFLKHQLGGLEPLIGVSPYNSP